MDEAPLGNMLLRRRRQCPARPGGRAGSGEGGRRCGRAGPRLPLPGRRRHRPAAAAPRPGPGTGAGTGPAPAAASRLRQERGAPHSRVLNQAGRTRGVIS